jgi:hypothetical protein
MRCKMLVSNRHVLAEVYDGVMKFTVYHDEIRKFDEIVSVHHGSFYCNDVDAIYEKLKELKLSNLGCIETTSSVDFCEEYGMNEFEALNILDRLLEKYENPHRQ